MTTITQAELNALVYDYLKQHHADIAKGFKKCEKVVTDKAAAKAVFGGKSLEDFFSSGPQYSPKAGCIKVEMTKKPSAADSDSDSESDEPKKAPVKRAHPADSSSDSDETPPKKKAAPKKAPAKKEESSDDDSSSSEPPKKKAAPKKAPAKKEESSDDSSSDDDEPPKKKAAPKKAPAKKEESSDDSSDDEPEKEVPKKTPAKDTSKPAANGGNKGNNGNGGKKEVKHFCRINLEKVKFADERLKDNTYESLRPEDEMYGEFAYKAHQDLIVTKGKGFTKAKNKKKKATYRAGVIDQTPRSFVFPSDSEE